MFFSCEKMALQMAISTAAKAASARSTMPVLEGILFDTAIDSLKLTGYDLKKAIYTEIEANVEEQGSIVLNARMIGNIVNSMPEGTVTLETEGMNAKINCGNAEFHIIGNEPEDYPELPDVEGKTAIALPQNILSKMIRETIFAVSDNESRPIYTGELFEIDNGMLMIVAVDGYRLALRREPVSGIETEHRFIVPGNALSDLEKLCKDTEEPVGISLGDNHISFVIGNTVLISRRLDGEFMDYRKSVPSDFRIRVMADRNALQRSIERVSLVIDDRVRNPLRCTFTDNEIHIVCATPMGKAEDYFSVDGDGNGLEIGFNNRYLLDALKAAPADEICVCLNTGTSPCVIFPADEPKNFLYMILPVRLKAE